MIGKNGHMSTYSNGFKHGVALDGEPLHRAHSGQVFYVGDGDTAGNTPAVTNRKGASDGNKGTFLDPFKTLDYAIEQCTAGRGDTIYVLPGYAQDIEAAAGVAFDVADIKVIGLGVGDEQAELTMSDEAATCTVEGAGVAVSGLRFHNSDTGEATAAALVVDADNVTIQGNKFDTEDAATQEWLNVIDVEGAITGTKIVGNSHDMVDEAPGANAFVLLDGACVDTTVAENDLKGRFAKGCVNVEAGGANVDLRILDNVSQSLGASAAIGSGVLLDDETATTSSSGLVAGNDHFSSGAVIASAGTETYFVGENPHATSLGGQALNVAAAPMDSYVSGEVEVEGTTSVTGIAGVTGTVAIWGVLGKAADGGMGAASKFDLGAEGALTGLWTENDVNAEAVGDIIYSTTGGGAQAVIEVANPLPATWLWPTPVLVSNAEIDITAVEIETTATAGLMDFVFVYQPVTPGASIGA